MNLFLIAVCTFSMDVLWWAVSNVWYFNVWPCPLE